MNKHMLLIGGIGIAGAIALVVLMREKSSAGSATQALPQQAEQPSSFPSYPAPPPLPPFSVNATPYYLTFNIPPNRSEALNKPAAATGNDGCHCNEGCNDDAKTVTLSNSFLQQNAKNARKAFSSGPNSGSMMLQFPPSDYPWLYQKGGSA